MTSMPLAESSYTIKKESPNEGTETAGKAGMYICKFFIIKKESPNEGTETTSSLNLGNINLPHKKRIPE